MESLLDSIRKDIDVAQANFATCHADYLTARKRYYAAECKLENLKNAERNLEIELERTQNELRTW
jgi:hypothetical protein